MVAAKDRDWQNRQHFFAIAARAMRRYLIDHARGRPNAEFIALEGIENLLPASSAKLELAVTVDRLLEELAKTKPEWCTLVEVKYFLGLTDEEAAETDRKSTRLNSSHSQISYAVFCLKKKKYESAPFLNASHNLVELGAEH